MNELLDGLWRASLWLALGVILLATVRPLLVRLGGAGLVYRSWWLLPLLLAALLLVLLLGLTMRGCGANRNRACPSASVTPSAAANEQGAHSEAQPFAYQAACALP